MPSIAIREARVTFEDYAYRLPMKFRATVVDRVTLLNVEMRVETEAGDSATGFGSMPLGNVWSFPSATLSFDETLSAMKKLAMKIGRIAEAYRGSEHPVEIDYQLEPLYLDCAAQLGVGEPVPKLCTLVAASAFDAAIHDAYGKAWGIDCYETYGAEHMKADLSRYLDQSFRGEYPDRYIASVPAGFLYVYHLAGALDPLTAGDVASPAGDGLPETLEEWVRAEGVNHIKIKLDGNDLPWDVARVVAVDSVVSGIEERGDWRYSLDFNERCPNAEYVLDCFARVRQRAPEAYRRIQYVEQPAPRDLNAAGSPDVHAIAKQKPVVIDESLVDYESLLRAREKGYSGVALKACKGQSQALLMAAAAKKFGMFLCVQDLTCPGASFLHSVGLAAHIPPIAAVEGNGRQYVPAANEPWKARFPEIFQIAGGKMRTGSLRGPGLGITPPLTRSLHAN
jgi:L-alanine-DL-glutamate epimerase-like enolase superfamily enzyme